MWVLKLCHCHWKWMFESVINSLPSYQTGRVKRVKRLLNVSSDSIFLFSVKHWFVHESAFTNSIVCWYLIHMYVKFYRRHYVRMMKCQILSTAYIWFQLSLPISNRQYLASIYIFRWITAANIAERKLIKYLMGLWHNMKTCLKSV